ncbi:unnamed protein product [Clonostachys rosea f. rosea IK726]|uniref:Uncharacterized protein n=2 Tax=Bionectria ochroleuca TaxID=29856 RepID=A0A0B7K240_BIOOC|nr:unnamed protein product [Clonostachys rosea f. rosea IK726]
MVTRSRWQPYVPSELGCERASDATDSSQSRRRSEKYLVQDVPVKPVETYSLAMRFGSLHTARGPAYAVPLRDRHQASFVQATDGLTILDGKYSADSKSGLHEHR